jgi:hypothetical protein
MNKQKTFTDMEYAQRKHDKAGKKFPDSMDAVIPWAAFEEMVRLFYPKSGQTRQAAEGNRGYAADVFPASPVQFGGRVS